MSQTAPDSSHEDEVAHFIMHEARDLEEARFVIDDATLPALTHTFLRITAESLKGENYAHVLRHGSRTSLIYKGILFASGSFSDPQFDQRQFRQFLQTHDTVMQELPVLGIKRISKNSPVELTIAVGAASTSLILIAVNWILCSWRADRRKDVVVKAALEVTNRMVMSDNISPAERKLLLEGYRHLLETKTHETSMIAVGLRSPAGSVEISSKS